MNTWKVILSTLVIFIAGLVTGGLLVTNALRVKQLVTDTVQDKQSHPKPPNNFNAQGGNPWQIRNKELLRRMDRELELTPEQHEHIETIIATSQERTKFLWKPIAQQMGKEMQLARAEIRDQLNPDQKIKFDGFAKAHPGQERHHASTNFGPADATNSVPVNPSATNALPTNP